jgi:histidyl-tRNA synthetase
MKAAGVKFMRDFFPDEMRVRQWIEDQWRRVSVRAGFEPWDAPILEQLELYKRKSGPDIVRQLYTLTDQGGRELAIRPEMTPSLARMVAQRQAMLPRPIKWFCIARMCRYERGQRGRLREFFQWNADILGIEGPIADAEVISVALDGLEAVGLTCDDIDCRVNSRSLLAALLVGIGIPADRHAEVYAVTDKRGKIPEAELSQRYRELGLAPATLERLLELVACASLDDVRRFAVTRGIAGHESELDRLEQLFGYLDALGKSPFCRFDVGVVRGLAYYTGPVFEIFDKGTQLRAICGGGRYDHLLELMGGQPLPAVGFGLGDVVLTELLKERNRLPADHSPTEYYLVALEPERLADALRLAQRLRARGIAADYAMRTASLSKSMKRAGDAGVQNVVLVGGREWSDGRVRVRDMKSGQEVEIPIDRL